MKKAKSVSTRVVKKQLNHSDYKECLLNTSKKYFRIQKKIVRQKHMLYTFKQNKISLNAFDDKRYLQDDGINTFAYEHYLISTLQY